MDAKQDALDWVTSQLAYDITRFVRESEKRGCLRQNTTDHIRRAQVHLTALGIWDQTLAKIGKYYKANLSRYLIKV